MIQMGGQSPRAIHARKLLKRHRFLLLETTWLAYIIFTLVGHSFCGVSVLLPSILLCGFATWLYGYKTGVLTSFLSQPYNVLVMVHHLGYAQGWRAALDPGGLTAQLLTVAFVAVATNIRNKSLELTEIMEDRIQQRNEELQEITEYMINRSLSKRSKMTTQLCDIVAYQLTELLFHSESLRNFLAYAKAPQTDDAEKLMNLAAQAIEQVKNLTHRLSPQKLMNDGIEQSLHKMCTYFKEATDTNFVISISDHSGDIPKDTSLNIYRIAHETVTNALRHGKATHIDLTLKLTEKICTLEVVNNGTPMPRTPNEGLGMRLIQQRASSINATTTFETIADGRTRFVCVAPFQIGTNP